MRKTVGIIMLVAPLVAIFTYFVITHGIWNAIGSFVAAAVFSVWVLIALGLISSNRRIS